MRRLSPLLTALALVPACLEVETFFFAGEPIDGYRWDEAAPELDGDLGEAHPSIVPAADRTEGFVDLDDGRSVHWIFARREGARTTMLFSHGNGPHLGRSWDRVERLWELGYHVLAYDYPGYGRSTGTASEEGLYASAFAVWDRVLADLPDVDRDDVVLYGHSLGGGPALQLASRVQHDAIHPRAVIVESTWCSIEAQIQDGAFLDLPRELLTHLEIDNCARLSEIDRVPVMILHGSLDDTVPVRQVALLEDAARTPPTVHVVAGARHTDVPIVAGADYDAWIHDHVATAPRR